MQIDWEDRELIEVIITSSLNNMHDAKIGHSTRADCLMDEAAARFGRWIDQ